MNPQPSRRSSNSGKRSKTPRLVHALRASHATDVGCDVGARISDRKCGAVVDLEAPRRILIIFLLPSITFRLSRCKDYRLGTAERQKQGVTAKRELHAISTSTRSFKVRPRGNIHVKSLSDMAGMRQDSSSSGPSPSWRDGSKISSYLISTF